MPQNSILFSGSVKDNITYGLGSYTQEQLDKAVEMANLKEFIDKLPQGIDTRIGENGDKLSGGQKQRITIARALIRNPEILILDEATSMLDPKGRNEVMSVVKDLNKNHGLTVINITHYMDEAVNSDRIFVLHGGKIAMQGTPAGIFAKKDEIRACGLELPRAASLAEKLRAAGIELDGQILTKEELATKLCESLPKI